MIEATHKRCKHRIQDPDGTVRDYGSINAAKRESRSIGLGKIENVLKLMNITKTLVMYKAQNEPSTDHKAA